MELVVEHFRAKAGTFEVVIDKFEVRTGEIGCVLGRSGSGKTTFLQGLAGFIPVEATTQILSGGEHSEMLPPEKRKFAIVLQRPTLFPHLSVRGNVGYSLRFQSLSKAERRRREDLWMERSDLLALADRRPEALSQGQQQRVAFARALATGYSVLLLDEPFAALDVQSRVELRGVLKRLVTEARVATVLVTHHPEDARAVSDHVLVVDSGKVLWRGKLTQETEIPVVVRELLSGERTPAAAAPQRAH